MPSTIERSPQNRLPAITEEPSRFKQVATGAAALLGTLALVVGVPIALFAAFGTPWPDQKPSVEWLSTPTTGETVLSVLAVVVWLAWAHFVVCLVVEAVAERRKSGLAPRIPGGGIGTQGLARRLVSAIVLLAATTSVGMSSASAVESSAPTAAAQSQFASQVMARTDRCGDRRRRAARWHPAGRQHPGRRHVGRHRRGRHDLLRRQAAARPSLRHVVGHRGPLPR